MVSVYPAFLPAALLLVALLPAGFLPAPGGAARAEYKVGRADIQKLGREMQDVFAGLQYILNAYQIRQFLSLENDSLRREWLKVFWKRQDPTPTTRKNEMEIEHTIRVGLARQFFTSKKWPGWDKRGEVFVRYGPPDYRGKIWGEVTVKKMRPPGEIWYYRKHDMIVSFQNFGLKGEYIYSIDPLGGHRELSPELVESLRFDTDQSLTSKIPQNLLEPSSPTAAEEPPQFADPSRMQSYLMSRPRDLPESIDAIMDPDLPGMLPKDVSAIFQMEKARELTDNFEIVLNETPSSYPFNFERNSLPFYFAVDQFKAGENSNRVEVHIELPVSIEGGAGEASEEVYHTEVVLWDTEFEEVSRHEKDIVLRSGPEVAGWANLLPTQAVFALGRGYYRMGISIREKSTGRSSAYRVNIACEPFDAAPALSDMIFATKIEQSDNPSVFSRGPLEVIPHPYRGYSRTFAVPIYFEIYNLTLDDRGVSSYTVEYKIVPHARTKTRFWDRYRGTAPVVSSKFQSSGFGADEVQYVFVHTENLEKGAYDFLITVTDDLSQSVNFKKGTFSIID
jgi:GWxTD domain-containing protein